jgi:hypothetical protein
MSFFKGMKEAEQTKGGNWVEPGRHRFLITKNLVKDSQNKKKHVGAKFFISELLVIESTVHVVGATRSWLVDFSKPGALGNLKNYGLALFPTLNPSYTADFIRAWDDDQWDKMFTWLCGPANPVHGQNVRLDAEAWHKDTDSGGKFTMVDWSPLNAAASLAKSTGAPIAAPV